MGTPRFTPAVVVWLVAATSSASTIWNGPAISFTKVALADPNLAENQDRITDKVWLTRGNTQGIYNAKTEAVFDKPPIILNSISPAGTEWAFGTTDDIESLSFDTWIRTVGQSPPSSVGQPMVLHLVEDDIFLDLTFTAWGTSRGAGGSFSYRRSTAVIPEPSSLLLIAALASAGIVVRYRATRALD